MRLQLSTCRPSAPPTPSSLVPGRRPVVQAGDACEARASAADPEYVGIYLHARYFDPQLGTFLSPDPIGVAGGMNQYAYALGNPVNGSDRSGLDWADCRDGTGDTCWYDDDTHYNSYVEVVEYYDAREDLRHLAEGPIDLLTRKIWLANSARNQLRKEMQADIDEQDRAAAETTVTSDGAASSAEAAAAGVQAGRDMLVGQLDNLATRFKEYLFDGVDPCKTGYVDVNFTFSPGVVGPTAGIQITKNGVHVYGGVNGGTPNVSVGISGSLQDPSPGLNGAVSGASSPGVSSNWQAGYGPIGTGTGSVLWRAGRCLGRPGSICPAALR